MNDSRTQNNDDTEPSHWLQNTVSLGQLIVAFGLGIAGFIGFELGQERRLTELTERQQIMIEKFLYFQNQSDKQRELLQTQLEKINDRLTELMILNARLHPQRLQAEPEERTRPNGKIP